MKNSIYFLLIAFLWCILTAQSNKTEEKATNISELENLKQKKKWRQIENQELKNQIVYLQTKNSNLKEELKQIFKKKWTSVVKYVRKYVSSDITEIVQLWQREKAMLEKLIDAEELENYMQGKNTTTEEPNNSTEGMKSTHDTEKSVTRVKRNVLFYDHPNHTDHLKTSQEMSQTAWTVEEFRENHYRYRKCANPLSIPLIKCQEFFNPQKIKHHYERISNKVKNLFRRFLK